VKTIKEVVRWSERPNILSTLNYVISNSWLSFMYTTLSAELMPRFKDIRTISFVLPTPKLAHHDVE
jgi:hypothetical protein